MAKSKVSQKDTIKQEITDLPFVKKITGKINGKNFWAVRPSGYYVKDCQTGKAYAALALEYMIKNNDPTVLINFVFGMAKSYRDDGHHGIEVGFLDFIAKAVISCPLSPSYMLAKDEQQHRQIMRYFDKMEEAEKEATGGEV